MGSSSRAFALLVASNCSAILSTLRCLMESPVRMLVYHPPSMVVLQFHLEVGSCGDVYWAIRSPDVPGLYARARGMVECQRVAVSILRAVDIDTGDLGFELAS